MGMGGQQQSVKPLIPAQGQQFRQGGEAIEAHKAARREIVVPAQGGQQVLAVGTVQEKNAWTLRHGDPPAPHPPEAARLTSGASAERPARA